MNLFVRHPNTSSYVLLAALLVAARQAQAEGGCPPGQVPQQFGPVMGCAPGGNGATAWPASSAGWASRWGAIATDAALSTFGVAERLKSKRRARSAALKACKAYGGVDCEVKATYSNGCAVLVAGDRVYNTQAEETLEAAADRGIAQCSVEDTDCQVVYAGCSPAEWVN